MKPLISLLRFNLILQAVLITAYFLLYFSVNRGEIVAPPKLYLGLIVLGVLGAIYVAAWDALYHLKPGAIAFYIGAVIWLIPGFFNSEFPEVWVPFKMALSACFYASTGLVLGLANFSVLRRNFRSKQEKGRDAQPPPPLSKIVKKFKWATLFLLGFMILKPLAGGMRDPRGAPPEQCTCSTSKEKKSDASENPSEPTESKVL